MNEIAEMGKLHGMEMFKRDDKGHLDAMNEMKRIMSEDGAMKKWMEDRGEFDALPACE